MSISKEILKKLILSSSEDIIEKSEQFIKNFSESSITFTFHEKEKVFRSWRVKTELLEESGKEIVGFKDIQYQIEKNDADSVYVGTVFLDMKPILY